MKRGKTSGLRQPNLKAPSLNNLSDISGGHMCQVRGSPDYALSDDLKDHPALVLNEKNIEGNFSRVNIRLSPLRGTKYLIRPGKLLRFFFLEGSPFFKLPLT